MISIKHNFVFIHPPKTGGNTIHNILKKYYDPVINTEIIDNIVGKNQGVRFTTRQLLDDGTNKRKVPNKHWTYSQIINCYRNVPFEEPHPDSKFEHLKELKLISTIRNPYERIVSFYCFANKGCQPGNFKKWYEGVQKDSGFPSCVKHWSDYEPDFVVRIEHFEEDVTQLLYYLGLPINFSKMLNINASTRDKQKQPYQNFYRDSKGKYDEKLIDKVRQDYSDDFEFSKKLFIKPYGF